MKILLLLIFATMPFLGEQNAPVYQVVVDSPEHAAIEYARLTYCPVGERDTAIGMRTHNGTLYEIDIDNMVVVEIETFGIVIAPVEPTEEPLEPPDDPPVVPTENPWDWF